MANVTVVSLLVPVGDLPLDRRALVIEITVAQCVRLANNQTDFKALPLGVRALAGNDLGRTPQFWAETVSATLGTANTYEDSTISGTTARDRVCGIYGVHVASNVDSISGLRYRVGGKRVHQWDLQAVLADQPHLQRREDRTMFLYPFGGQVTPVIIPPNTGVLVQHYVRSGTAVGIQPSEVVQLGVVVEPNGGGGAELSPLAWM